MSKSDTISNKHDDLKIAKSQSINLGDKLCFLVYSNQRHVPYINKVLSKSEMLLSEHGFSPIRLGNNIVSDEDYLAKISELIPKCQLALVILDGLRPNVLFEFGYLKALNKILIILKSNKGLISIKSLYKNHLESGLQDKHFQNKLREPRIDINFHISDFAGKHVQPFDIDEEKDDEKTLDRVLLKEIEAKKESLKKNIIKATANQASKRLS